jgi:hypothetical protein
LSGRADNPVRESGQPPCPAERETLVRESGQTNKEKERLSLSSSPTGNPYTPFPGPDEVSEPDEQPSPLSVPLTLVPDGGGPDLKTDYAEFVATLNDACGRTGASRFRTGDPRGLAKYEAWRRQYERSGGAEGYDREGLLAVARGAALDPNRMEHRQYQSPVSVLRSQIIEQLRMWGSGVEAPPTGRSPNGGSNGHAASRSGGPAVRGDKAAMAKWMAGAVVIGGDEA